MTFAVGQPLFSDLDLDPAALKLAGGCDEPDGLLIDITGVLYNGTPSGGEAIPGSVAAWSRLLKWKKPVKLCSNETQTTRETLAAKLQRIGFDVTPSDIICPGPVVKELLQERGWRPHLLVHPNQLPEFEGVDQTNPNCVVIGDAAEYFTYERMNTTFQLLVDMKPPQLISMGKGKYYMENGKLTLDVGPYKAALEYATGCTAEIVGKPSPSYFEGALKHLGITDPSRAVMIGDDIVNDVGGAQEFGMRGIQVRTGKFRSSDETREDVTPDRFCDNLKAAVDYLLD